MIVRPLLGTYREIVKLAEITHQQIVGFLRTVPVFSTLGNEHLEKVAESATIRDFASGEIALQCGSDFHEMFIIIRGELVAIAEEKVIGFERELEILYPGEYFGLISLLIKEQAAITVRAQEPSKAIAVSRNVISNLMATSPDFAAAVCRSLAWFVREKLSALPAVPFARLESFPNAVSTSSLIPARMARHFQAIAVEKDEELSLIHI